MEENYRNSDAPQMEMCVYLALLCRKWLGFIHLLSDYCVPGILPGTGKRAMSNTNTCHAADVFIALENGPYKTC